MINVIKHCRIKYKLKYLWFFVFVYVFLLIKFFVCFFPTCFCILGNFFFCVKNITHEVNIYVRYHNLVNFMSLFIRQEYSSVCTMQNACILLAPILLLSYFLACFHTFSHLTRFKYACQYSSQFIHWYNFF